MTDRRANLFALRRACAIALAVMFILTAAGWGQDVRPDAKLAKKDYQRGLAAETAQDWRGAHEAYAAAALEEPKNQEYALRRDIARSRLVQEFVDRAERDAISNRLPQARAELSAAIALDPGDDVARERWNELNAPTANPEAEREEKFSGAPHLQPKPGVHDFEYRGETRGAFEEVARQFGVHAEFDIDLLPRQVHMHFTGLDFPTAMRVLCQMTGTFWRPINRDIFFVAQNTTQKRREYEPSVLSTILLPASATPEDMTELLRVVREVTGITRSDLDTRSRTITLRATPTAIALARAVINELEIQRGEMVLEIEILDVNRNAARNIGILPPQSAKAFSLSSQQINLAQSGLQGIIQVIQQLFGTPSALSGLTPEQIAALVNSGQTNIGSLVPPIIAFGGGLSTFFATMPGATANFSEVLSLVRNGQRILLRAEDGRPATLFVGDRIPVSYAQFSGSLGSSVFIPGVTSQSFPTSALITGASPAAATTGTFRSASGSHVDIVAANHSDNTVSIFLGNGDGTFGAKTDFATGNGPSALVTGVFKTGDTLDLAVANQTDGTVSVLLGHGDGTFAGKQDFPVGKSPVAIASGDFNADGNLDLAVVNQTDNTVSILLGRGDGTFQPQTTLATGRTPAGIAIGDFNGDGRVDFAVVNKTDNTVSIFLGKGDGTFTGPTNFTTGQSPVAIRTADVNGDNFADLEVANGTDNTVSILLGRGDGTFQGKTDFATNTSPDSLVIADFNLDGRLDIITANQGSDSVSLLLGIGDGTFGVPLDLAVGTSPSSVASADFNGDGRPDVVVANQGANTATVILNSTTTTPSSGSTTAGTPYPGVEYLDLGVKLKATPRLHPNNEVSLKMELEISALSGQSINDLPIVSHQAVVQTVRLKENETTLLAGILENQTNMNVNGSPGLAGLGGLGFLGGAHSRQIENDQLLILITPRRIRLADRVDKTVYAGPEPAQGQSSLGPTLEERRRTPEGEPFPP